MIEWDNNNAVKKRVAISQSKKSANANSKSKTTAQTTGSNKTPPKHSGSIDVDNCSSKVSDNTCFIFLFLLK